MADRFPVWSLGSTGLASIYLRLAQTSRPQFETSARKMVQERKWRVRNGLQVCCPWLQKSSYNNLRPAFWVNSAYSFLAFSLLEMSTNDIYLRKSEEIVTTDQTKSDCRQRVTADKECQTLARPVRFDRLNQQNREAMLLNEHTVCVCVCVCFIYPDLSPLAICRLPQLSLSFNI